ncbi:HD-GYP domain-containing protein [Pectinatus frisingensis]|uniref:HD-GYP domain-containing protein n=1 Tax=Pectinatus frisingensis TaxID=865 RepID=UPI0018C853C2|nr:HD-GYP domain-containing protein [Pectinatus frisingensis]
MIILPTAKLRPGMTTCQNIFDNSGLFLLRRGTKLTDFYITKLKLLGVKEIAVASTDTHNNFSMPNEAVSESTRAAAIKSLTTAFSDLDKRGIFIIENLHRSVVAIIQDVIHNKHVLVQMNDIRTYDNYTLVHSIDVSILAAIIGSLHSLSYEMLHDLTLGAMLHDLGKTAIPIEILNKTSPLSNDEFSIIRKHPIFSVHKLHDAGCFNSNIIDIAEQHHEKIDGSGYPRGLPDKRINFLAKIVAIADVYDALTSLRPYKKAYKPHIAFDIMMHHSPGQFDINILRTFFDNVAIYPNGTIIKTNLGSAIVKSSSFGKTLFPIIYIFTDKYNRLHKPILTDLSLNPVCFIENVYDDYEAINLINAIQFDPSSLLEDSDNNT